MVTREKRGRQKNLLMPSQETYLDLYAPLTFAERMGVRNQEIRHTLLFPCWLEVCVDMNVQQRLKRKQSDGKQRQAGGRQIVSSYAVYSSDERCVHRNPIRAGWGFFELHDVHKSLK